ncbi:hypothetical protein SLS63_003491 [Diaporthe eres]|uniref:Uncharacterized protein n=1 Tax=Diaporthe eres TaxID=83184 RepID=A0ABR1PG86_DIAER
MEEVSLGVDFGAQNSKMTVACLSPGNGGRLVVHRVPRLDLTHGADMFEFPALVALDRGSELLIELLAAEKERNWSGKLLNAIDSETITSLQLYNAVVAHFEHLRDAAADKARRASRFITNIVVTYPNYLCEDERADDFILYLTFHDELITSIWPNVTRRYAISEGQGGGIHATSDFDDPL